METTPVVYYAIASANVRQMPSQKATKLATAPQGQFLKVTGESFDVDGNRWVSVRFAKVNGWVYEKMLEVYLPESSWRVSIPDNIRTPDPFDAQQYINYENGIKHNLCGEFCAAYLADIGIVPFLQRWKECSPANYRVGVFQDFPVGIQIVEDMLACLGLDTHRFDVGLTDPIGKFLLSPTRLRNKINAGWMLLAGVKIGRSSGKLGEGLTGHWVVLTDVPSVYRNGDGLTKIYNPFSNQDEQYSYAEFISAMRGFSGSMSGIWVKE